ncbi:Sodium- and chloride-dependent glycine transporter 2 [Oopsacas minuta]|uniref:Sodium- and chloride-dependent glycine transporter 2 n=1 Tax=Oopsacas minuta TaxID=111878 RepID=A0AAV7KHF4_9METZ|nr:Sodium- and chloride-dependent glycine transporter 2 [Oopsacas minuta]
MMLSLGLDSMFASIDSLVQAAFSLPYVIRLHKRLVTAIICCSFFVVSVIFTFGNGLYIFQLIDQFSGSFAVFIRAFFELIGISWFYGVKKLLVGEMTVNQQADNISNLSKIIITLSLFLSGYGAFYG